MSTMPPDRTDQAFLHVVIDTKSPGCVDRARLIIRGGRLIAATVAVAREREGEGAHLGVDAARHVGGLTATTAPRG
jgi:hypothetical protein